jgi:hypothetical protein
MMRRRGFLFETVSRTSAGLSLGGHPFDDARSLVLHASNLVNRVQRWYLSR